MLDFGGGYGEKSNWKNVLSSMYGNKKGKKLSDAIRKAGHDGIVTVSKSGDMVYTSEIVDLGKPPSSTERPLPPAQTEPAPTTTYGLAYINDQQRPITEVREIVRGKKKGMVV